MNRLIYSNVSAHIDPEEWLIGPQSDFHINLIDRKTLLRLDQIKSNTNCVAGIFLGFRIFFFFLFSEGY